MSRTDIAILIVKGDVDVRRTWRLVRGRRVYGFRISRTVSPLLRRLAEDFMEEDQPFAADVAFPRHKGPGVYVGETKYPATQEGIQAAINQVARKKE